MPKLESVMTAPQHGPRVLVIEDDPVIAHTFLRGVERAGMQAAWAGTGALGVALKDKFRPHVALVDLTLPDMSGLALISRFVEQRDCGVVVVSGSGEEADRVVGLELGADDYIAKPMSMREMVARIRAVHRRVSLPKPSGQQETSGLELASPEGRVHPHRRSPPHGPRPAWTAPGPDLGRVRRAGGAGPLGWRSYFARRAVRGCAAAAMARRRPERGPARLQPAPEAAPDEDGGMLIQSIRGAGHWMRAPEGTAQPQTQDILAG